jgi:DNA polymerase-1
MVPGSAVTTRPGWLGVALGVSLRGIVVVCSFMACAHVGGVQYRDMATLVAIDGTNLLYRSYHALADTPRGEASGTPHWVLGSFVETVARQIVAHRPSSLIVALDGHGGCPSRRALAPGYKAGRSATPETLVAELGCAGELLMQLGIAVREVTDWEADDVLASVATMAGARDTRAVIVTSDKDGHQLIGGSVVICKPESGLVDDTTLREKYNGVTGSRWVEYAALVGEKSDNLPGVMGIGPKKAAAIITTFENVEDAMLHRSIADGFLGERTAGLLYEGIEIFRRNRLVATLKRDLEIDLTGIQLRGIDTQKVVAVAEELGISRAGRNLARAVESVARA